MNPPAARRRWLRRLRHGLAVTIATLVATFPALEPIVIAAGRHAATRSRLLAGLYWFVQEQLLARLRRRGERFRVVQVRSRHLQLDITDPTGRMPYFYRTPYEPGVTDALVSLLEPGDVFVDVGANVGYFTVLAAQLVGPRGWVIGFEPHAGAREMLGTTVQRNDASARVEIVPLALAEADGSATLFSENAVTAHSTIEPSLSPMRHVAALHASAIVAVTTLDGWLASRPDLPSRVRCVKIDVEGAEARVLGGMPQLLRSATLAIVCETSIGSDADGILAAAAFERRRLEPGQSPYGNFLYVRP